MASRQYVKFQSWDAVRAYAGTGQYLWYQAPLNTHPVTVRVIRAFKNGKLRIACGDMRFTADAGHLDRFAHIVTDE